MKKSSGTLRRRLYNGGMKALCVAAAVCTAALLFTAGFAHTLNGIFEGLNSAGATLTVALYVYAKEEGEFEVAFAIAAILMLLTLLINALTTLVGRYFGRRKRT